MSDQERENLPVQSGEEESTNTADVREAIERAKDATAMSTAETTALETPEGEAIEASGLTPAEHADTSTEAMLPVQETVTISESVEMPSAAAPVVPATPVAPAQTPGATPGLEPGAMVISPDHPMAALYMQQPDAPVLKSNRLAGLFISLLATLGFGVIYAGLLALWLARHYPPSTFLQEGLYPYLVSLGFVIPCGVFFVTMLALVLIFNRAGWWVYAVLGFFVAIAVWASAGVGYALSPQLIDAAEGARHNIRDFAKFALTIPALVAAVSAREVAVWFGAWIGARGRRLKIRNAAAQEEYEQKLAELKVPQAL